MDKWGHPDVYLERCKDNHCLRRICAVPCDSVISETRMGNQTHRDPELPGSSVIETKKKTFIVVASEAESKDFIPGTFQEDPGNTALVQAHQVEIHDILEK